MPEKVAKIDFISLKTAIEGKKWHTSCLGRRLTEVERIREIITSSQNKYVSLARGLANKKNRENEKKFRFDGVKLLCEAVKAGLELDFLLICEREESAVLEKAERLYGVRESDISCKAMTVSAAIFDKLSEEQAPEGVIAVAKYASSLHCERAAESLKDTEKAEKILLLESVRDPQNVGAIIRVAAAFGVDRIVISRDCADIYSSKTVRASMGTLFSIKIDKVEDIPCAIKSLAESGRRIFAAALNREAQRLGEFSVLEGDCVVIGNEGHGLSIEAIEACGRTVFIPMSDRVESLNAATAAAVLVWEFFGSQGKGGKQI